jgi:hypothetical protein
VFALAATAASAQSDGDETASAGLRLGPVRVKPSIALTNAGIDGNVFNSKPAERDFTMTVTPRAELSMRVARARLTGVVKEDLVYFHRFESERSANTSGQGTIVVPFNRLTLTASGEYLNIRDRPGFEIDARSQRTERGSSGTIEVRPFGKTFIGLTVSRADVRFDRDVTFFGSSLAHELNRTMMAASVSVRHQLTPVTSIIGRVDRQQDRFEFSHLRDSTSTKVTGGMQFDPFGLIAGSAVVGYRTFTPSSPGIVGYRGLITSIGIAVRATGSMRLGVQAVRDIQYSYDIVQPYYMQTGVEGTIQRQITGPLDLLARIGVQHLSYRGRVGSSASGLDRTDAIHSFGGGIGYRIGRAMRIGLNVDKQHRTSDLVGHGYDGLRYGTSVTYGF